MKSENDTELEVTTVTKNALKRTARPLQKEYDVTDRVKTTVYLPIELHRRILYYKADKHPTTTYGRNDVIVEALEFFLTAMKR